MGGIPIPAGFIEEFFPTVGVVNDVYHYGGNTDSQTNTQIHIAAIIASKAQQLHPGDVLAFRAAWGANVIATSSAIHILQNDWNDPTKGWLDYIADSATVAGDVISTAATAVNFLPGVDEAYGKN